MRKKPTYEELANSTLAKSVVKPVDNPYNLPNDNTTAVAEFKRMLAEDEIRQIIGGNYRAATTAAARESGLPRECFEDLARRVVTDGSNMHNETRNKVKMQRPQPRDAHNYRPKHCYVNIPRKTSICRSKWKNR